MGSPTTRARGSEKTQRVRPVDIGLEEVVKAVKHLFSGLEEEDCRAPKLPLGPERQETDDMRETPLQLQ